MKNYRFPFNFLDRENHTPVGYKYITCHLIFDVKMDSPVNLDMWLEGILPNPPFSMTYASVVSNDSVRLAFLVAELYDLDILAGDIHNTYLNAPIKEKVFFYSGDE